MKLAKNLSYDNLVAIIENDSHCSLPDSYYTVISIATQHSQAGCNLEEKDFDRLIVAGFSQSDIIEIMTICATAMFIANLTLAANIPIDEDHRVNGFKKV